jgi:sec-independent protein translocase protein TatB
LEDLRGLRDFNPRTAVRRTLFESDDAPQKPNGYPAPNGSSTPTPATPTPAPPAPLPSARQPAPGERPPIDPDAT